MRISGLVLLYRAGDVELLAGIEVRGEAVMRFRLGDVEDDAYGESANGDSRKHETSRYGVCPVSKDDPVSTCRPSASLTERALATTVEVFDRKPSTVT